MIDELWGNEENSEIRKKPELIQWKTIFGSPEGKPHGFMKINQEAKFIEIETARSSTRASSFRESGVFDERERERSRWKREKECYRNKWEHFLGLELGLII